MDNESRLARGYSRPIAAILLGPPATLIALLLTARSVTAPLPVPVSVWLLLFCLQAASLAYLFRAQSRSVQNTENTGHDEFQANQNQNHEQSQANSNAPSAHRAKNKHSTSGLPTREILVCKMGDDIENGLAQGVLGVIRFSDYQRLLDFDETSASEFLTKMVDRLIDATASHRLLSHVDHGTIAIWFAGTDTLEKKQNELAALSYALKNEMVLDDKVIRPTVEAGSVIFPTDGKDPKTLLNRAISTINLRRSNNGISNYSKPIEDDAKFRYNIIQKISRAIDNDELSLHYQPIVNLAAGKIVGAEALLRWPQSDGEMLSPAVFIPMIEESDISDRLGLWTINTACREAGEWGKSGMGDVKVAVNLSARQLRSAKLSETILRSTQLHDFSTQRLELELTETAAMEDIIFSAEIFERMRIKGISISIDDFGAGYSSFSYLKNLPFDKLKIDREFVKDVDQCADNQAICAALIALGRGLGIAVLAEGVEREGEVHQLAAMGCILFQGFYFGRPLPAQEFSQLGSDVKLAAKMLPPVARNRNQSANEMLKSKQL
ncbi:putative bifunctional diguanylate cyclase/phosphodiesterase [Tritonibacter scottomollicae]|uniref:putative bifunctional diguanylate cyclase/phosphodiesterase n=1 Tax=Tritonibacter scottomollicae TaxID=483013 RepID=UPI003AA9D987